AAGNLFTGDFQIDMGNPAKSTHFGRPFYKMLVAPLQTALYYQPKRLFAALQRLLC
ncbi:MAG: PCMD domain-containing protein, partial [Prevotella sp.]